MHIKKSTAVHHTMMRIGGRILHFSCHFRITFNIWLFFLLFFFHITILNFFQIVWFLSFMYPYNLIYVRFWLYVLIFLFQFPREVSEFSEKHYLNKMYFLWHSKYFNSAVFATRRQQRHDGHRIAPSADVQGIQQNCEIVWAEGTRGLSWAYGKSQWQVN